MMGSNNTKKTARTLMKRCLLLSFLCVLSLCIFIGWSRTLRMNPSVFSSSTNVTVLLQDYPFNSSSNVTVLLQDYPFNSSSNVTVLLQDYPFNSSSNVTVLLQDYPFNSSRNMTILLWHYPFGVLENLNGDVCWDLHRIPHCHLVDQQSMFSSADVVVFHNRELIQGSQKLPTDQPRPQGQRWAWMTLEAPPHNGNLHPFANIFNMTITYRRDADITIPYGELLPKEDEGHLVEDNLQEKTSLICWVVSNYNGNHKRSQVYNELNAIVPVKVYGQWTNMPLNSSALLPTISHCYFYLAFENSLCKDYITEKLWYNAYESGAVPVVLGASLSDYKAVAPPHSFIHVDEFASVRELANYLQELAKDKKRYAEYLTWKQHWKVKQNTNVRERLCKICAQFNSLPQHKVYSDLEAWDKTTSA